MRGGRDGLMNEMPAPRVALVARSTLFAEAVSRGLETAGIPVTTIAASSSKSVVPLDCAQAAAGMASAVGAQSSASFFIIVDSPVGAADEERPCDSRLSTPILTVQRQRRRRPVDNVD